MCTLRRWSPHSSWTLLQNLLQLECHFAKPESYIIRWKKRGMGSLGSVTDYEVRQLCRIVCAVNLQDLKELFKKLWAFSIGLDAGNNACSSYCDIRMWCFFKGNLQNLHLLAIPIWEQHTGEYQYNLVVSLLDVLAPNWRHELIGTAMDGASTMTGCIQGTCTHLSNECHSRIFQIWCGAHQLDLVMKRAFNKLCNEKFDCWHEVNMSNICHNSVAVNGKVFAVVDRQKS